jgi:hypothetical protein
MDTFDEAYKLLKDNVYGHDVSPEQRLRMIKYIADQHVDSKVREEARKVLDDIKAKMESV